MHGQRMRTLIFAGLGLAMLAGTAHAREPQARSARAEAALGKALAGRTAGKPQSCVQMNELGSSRIIDDRTIIFEGRGRTLWRNDVSGGCPGLSPSRALVTKSSTGQMCRGDIFRIIDPGTPISYGACAFGEFVPYTKAK